MMKRRDSRYSQYTVNTASLLHRNSLHTQALWCQYGCGCAGEHRPGLSLGSRTVYLPTWLPWSFLPGEPASPTYPSSLLHNTSRPFVSSHIPSPPPSFCSQDCDTGYTRVPSGLYLGTCERCNCHGHSETCEPETGACQVSAAPSPSILLHPASSGFQEPSLNLPSVPPELPAPYRGC